MTPTIVTASWFTTLPATYCRIGVSRGTPRGQSGYKRYPALQPGYWYKTESPAEYKARYFGEVLARLDPQTTVNELLALSEGRTPALLCFEKAHDAQWCHRGMVSMWLKETLGLEVFEFGREDDGCGEAHPKLPAIFRKVVREPCTGVDGSD